MAAAAAVVARTTLAVALEPAGIVDAIHYPPAVFAPGTRGDVGFRAENNDQSQLFGK